MANIKISALPAATTISGGDLLPVVQGGVTKQVTLDLLPLSAAALAALAGKEAAGAAAAAQAAAVASISNLIGAAPAALDTLKEIDDQLATDEGSAAALAAAVAGKAPLASPAFTGTPTIGGAAVAKATDVTAAILAQATSDAATYLTKLGPSNGTDDTVWLNTALAAGGAFRVTPGATYRLSAPLVLPSGIDFDTTGATFIGAASWSGSNMLTNRAAVTPNRTVSDAVLTAASTTVTSATAAFTSADVGRTVVLDKGNPGVNTVSTAAIASVEDGTTAVLTIATPTAATGATLKIYDRDKNIRVRGSGLFARGTVGSLTDDNSLHTFLFRRVDGLTIEPSVRITSAAAKYAVSIGDLTDSTVQADLSGGVSSDGIHIIGPARQVTVGARGTTGDDFIAIGSGDYTSYCDIQGDVTDIEVLPLRPTSSVRHLHIFGASSGRASVIQRITARGFSGVSTQTPVLIEQGEGTTAGTCYTTVDDITLADVMPAADGGSPTVTIGAPTTYSIGSVLIRNLHKAAAENVDVVRVQTMPGGSIRKLTVDGITIPKPIAPQGVVDVFDGSIATIALAHVDVKLADNGRLVNLGGQVTTLILDDVLVAGTGGAFLAYCSAFQTGLKIIARGVKLSGFGGGYPWWIAGIITLDLFGVDHGTCYQTMHIVDNRTRIRVRGAGIDWGNTSSHPIDGDAGALAYGSTFDLQTDVAQPTTGKTLGDTCWNINWDISCGYGQVVYTGTVWKNLITGATY